MQNCWPIFPVILRIFDLKCHGQISLKLSFIMFGLIFENLMKLTSLHRKIENSIAIKLRAFSLHKSFPIPWDKNWCQNIILNLWLTSSDWNLGQVYLGLPQETSFRRFFFRPTHPSKKGRNVVDTCRQGKTIKTLATNINRFLQR